MSTTEQTQLELATKEKIIVNILTRFANVPLSTLNFFFHAYDIHNNITHDFDENVIGAKLDTCIKSLLSKKVIKRNGAFNFQKSYTNYRFLYIETPENNEKYKDPDVLTNDYLKIIKFLHFRASQYVHDDVKGLVDYVGYLIGKHDALFTTQD